MINKIDIIDDGLRIVVSLNDHWFVSIIERIDSPMMVPKETKIITITDQIEIKRYLMENLEHFEAIPEIQKYLFYDDVLKD